MQDISTLTCQSEMVKASNEGTLILAVSKKPFESWKGRVDWGSPVWSSILPQSALGRVGSHLRIEGGGGHWGDTGFWFLYSGSVTDGFRIKQVRNQICSESERFGIRQVQIRQVPNQIGSKSDRFGIRQIQNKTHSESDRFGIRQIQNQTDLE